MFDTQLLSLMVSKGITDKIFGLSALHVLRLGVVCRTKFNFACSFNSSKMQDSR